MTLVQLKHFIELARLGSFSRAAHQLHLTQPALSRSIKALEDELGQAVFDRVGRQIELTPFGQQIMSRAHGLVDEARELRVSAKKLQQGEIGNLRIGLGSGPGAMLMTPLLMFMATEHPKAHLDIARGSTALLVQALRERQLDALVLDIRSLKPSPDLKVEVLQEMKGTFMCRKTHPLARKKQVPFAALREFPIASTPLSDEVARILMERYGPEAHPDTLVNLRCEEISSLVDVARTSDAVVLTIRHAAPDLVEIPVVPALQAKARFGLVTMAARSEAPFLGKLREMMRDILTDA
jgi:DNA-binding transcriptional LysR family regulator